MIRQIREAFGIKPLRAPDKFTMHHPDLEGQTELAFIAGGIHFYRFKEEYKHPVGRYKYVYKFLKEHELAMNRETLAEYIKQLKTCLNGGSKGQNINIGEAWRLLHNMDTRLFVLFGSFLLIHYTKIQGINIHSSDVLLFFAIVVAKIHNIFFPFLYKVSEDGVCGSKVNSVSIPDALFKYSSKESIEELLRCNNSPIGLVKKKS